MPPIMKPSLLALAALTLAPGAALAAGTQPCLTNDVVAFGASVTQATPAFVPAYAGIVSGVELYGDRYGKKVSSPASETIAPLPSSTRPFGLSPVRYIVKTLGGKAALENVTYLGKFFTNSREDLGSTQAESLLGGTNRAAFADATLVVGVDAFYWDAIFNNCAYGRSGGVEGTIQRLTQAAKASGKVLILGNVPVENENNVRINNRRTTVNAFWWPPVPSCVTSINATLERECKEDQGCYIVDLFQTAKRLNHGEQLQLASEPGQNYGLYDMRPDGVHMSDKGSRYIAELALRALQAHPPTCPAGKNRAEEKAKLMEELGLPL